MASAEQNDAEVDWTAVQYLVSSTHRFAVANALADDGPLTPTAISEQCDLPATHVSRAMNALREEGLAELLVPESTRKGRIYDLTDAGEDALPVAREVND